MTQHRSYASVLRVSSLYNKVFDHTLPLPQLFADSIPFSTQTTFCSVFDY